MFRSTLLLCTTLTLGLLIAAPVNASAPKIGIIVDERAIYDPYSVDRHSYELTRFGQFRYGAREFLQALHGLGFHVTLTAFSRHNSASGDFSARLSGSGIFPGIHYDKVQERPELIRTMNQLSFRYAAASGTWDLSHLNPADRFRALDGLRSLRSALLSGLLPGLTPIASAPLQDLAQPDDEGISRIFDKLYSSDERISVFFDYLESAHSDLYRLLRLDTVVRTNLGSHYDSKFDLTENGFDRTSTLVIGEKGYATRADYNHWIDFSEDYFNREFRKRLTTQGLPGASDSRGLHLPNRETLASFAYHLGWLKEISDSQVPVSQFLEPHHTSDNELLALRVSVGLLLLKATRPTGFLQFLEGAFGREESERLFRHLRGLSWDRINELSCAMNLSKNAER